LSWSRRCIWLGWLVLIVVGILLQPNLSTSALCGSLLWWLACWSGISWIYLSLIGLGGLSLAGISLSLKAYQRSRIISFLTPWNYSTDEVYQLVQSLLAIGSGGLSGTGWGLSYQKLFYLPIQSTDFIFAVFAEELGFLGSWLFFFFILSYSVLGIKLIILTKEPIHRLVALGSIMILIGQTLMNVGVTVGLLPTTGLPMPFWSYGGNAMISSLIVASFLIQIAKENYSD
jgi:cell division protein FtsW